jgi:hypothetical protein
LLPFIPQPVSTDSHAGAPTIEIPPAVNPGNPTLSVIPETGSAGSTFTIKIEDFTPEETVTVTIKTPGAFDIVYQKVIKMSSEGNAFVEYVSPNNAASLTYGVEALGANESASGHLTIAP